MTKEYSNSKQICEMQTYKKNKSGIDCDYTTKEMFESNLRNVTPARINLSPIYIYNPNSTYRTQKSHETCERKPPS